ncbi:hypothetical protein dsx2_0582 [Desulfovibrio sp. X2]|uniref:hypothetical protein n=1 Tax=Desulfovibrio sp. X2 TaxID=941449 RepID=UPI000358D2AB|nr:hypothetical protein [Desulfovibrio sp. X2]EPR37650.1 hypothetical protein dsx2_0582 [Desulfovibrio sp. X2]
MIRDRISPFPRLPSLLLFSLLLLAGLLAALPVGSARAGSLDWMPADDAVGFWGARLPIPEDASGLWMGSFYTNQNGDFIIDYRFTSGKVYHYIFFNLTKGTIDREWEGRTEEEKTLANSTADEYSERSGKLKRYREKFDMKYTTIHLVSGSTNSTPLEFGIQYSSNNEERSEAIIWTSKRTHMFSCYGYHGWTDGLPCNGRIHSMSLLMPIGEAVLPDKTILKMSGNASFVIRFKEDMSSPYIASNPELVRLPFKEAYGLYIKTAQRLRAQKPANLLEAVDAIVTPYFQDKLKSKENK